VDLADRVTGLGDTKRATRFPRCFGTASHGYPACGMFSASNQYLISHGV
jgi:hypothetical protein